MPSLLLKPTYFGQHLGRAQAVRPDPPHQVADPAVQPVIDTVRADSQHPRGGVSALANRDVERSITRA